MIVVDSSFIVDFLIKSSDQPDIADIISEQQHLAAPNLIEYEVVAVLRRHNVKGELSDDRAVDALKTFRSLALILHPVGAIEERAWELRKNISYYDATYVALAELLGVPLYTLDKKLASAPGHSAKIICL